MLLIAMALFAAQAGEPPTITNPSWERRPSAGDFERYYPSAVLNAGRGGRAVTQCDVGADGLLEHCVTIEETPVGNGFGDAALKMMGLFKMRPQLRNGVPVAGGVVRIPITFQAGGGVDPVTGLLACYGATAAVAEASPEAQEAWRAATFFAAQISIYYGRATGRPSALESALTTARTQAPPASDGDRRLRDCLALAARYAK